MASGTLNVNSLVATEIGTLTQFEDTDLSTETHQEFLSFNDSLTDGTHGDGFVNKNMAIENLNAVISSTSPINDTLLTYNDNSVNSLIATGWVEKKVSDILESFQVTVEGLVTIGMSVTRGEKGNVAATDCVAFTDLIETGTNTMALASCGDNNIVLKREPTDSDFVFMAVLDKGEIINLQYPSGTIFRSKKGVSGFSSPFPMPFGVSSFSDIYFKFYALRETVSVYATSAGLESIVTLYSSDESTIIDGPYTIAPYETTTLLCPSNTEFAIIATKSVYCGTIGDRGSGITGVNRYIDMRLIPPMSLEIITFNRRCEVSSRFDNTLVRWYRRNGETGSFTVTAGIPVSIASGSINEDTGATNLNAGDTVDYGADGCVILRADKPITGFSGADSQGWEATYAYPLNQLSQVFPNPATIDDNTDAGRSSITISSPYEGTAIVYDSTQTVVASFTITRTVAVTTASDQLYPASGQWTPLSSGLTDFTGGYVEVNVPSYCVMNFNGSAIWSRDAGDEMIITGSTPEELRAEIVKDSSGIYRRRDIDTGGLETWNVC